MYYFLCISIKICYFLLHFSEYIVYQLPAGFQKFVNFLSYPLVRSKDFRDFPFALFYGFLDLEINSGFVLP